MEVIKRIHEIEEYVDVLQKKAYKHFEKRKLKNHKIVSEMISEQNRELEKLNKEFHSGQRTLRVRNVIYN